MSIGIVLRLVLICAALVGLSSSGNGQQQSDSGVCAHVVGTYDSIGAEIAQSKAVLDALKASGTASPGSIDEQRTKLADLLFRQDCVRPDLQPDPVRGPAAQPQWVTLTTYYATNRTPGPTVGAIATYTGNRDADGIRFGRVTVSIPTQRQPGELNLPLNLWLFELPADPSRHFIVKSVTPLAPDAAMNEMRDRVSHLSKKSVLIFVHGYNVPFQDAALRTAQLAHDLNFPGLPMFFSWPSLGTPGGYPHDEEVSQLSLDAFNRLLDRVDALHASEVFIIAHSMGNRVVTQALAKRLADGKPIPANLKGLLLAAPDINADIFREQIAPGLAGLTGTAKTIYASNNDAALRASSFLHDFPRVGLTKPSVLTFKGFETVDATGVAPVRRGYGHSYVVDSPRVIRDMQAMIFLHRDAAHRGLPPTGSPPGTYWTLQ